MNFGGRTQFKRLMCLLVRQNFSSECERVLNRQINLELKAMHEYLAMAYHFNRSDVALAGTFEYFKRASDEEYNHAQIIMKYMNKRGGQIVIDDIPAPKCSYESLLEAMTAALHLEKKVNAALLEAHAIATSQNDAQACDFIETQFLTEQVDALKQISDYIRQIERAQKELGIYVFDLNIEKSRGLHGHGKK